MLKWRLLLTTLPWMAVITILAIVRQSVLQIPALVEFADIGPLLTGAALIIGFMFAGVMADYTSVPARYQ